MFSTVTMETIGDTIQDKPLSSIGITSLFTKELEKELAADKIDMIVHSLKDLPSVLPDGMVITTVCKYGCGKNIVIILIYLLITYQRAQ